MLLGTFSITMLKISTGPRVYSFTPRVFGEYFVFLFLIGMHIYFLNGNLLFLGMSMLFGGLALNSSTFASQVLLLFSLSLSIVLQTFIPLGMFIMSIVMAILTSKGHYINIVTQQLKYSSKYATYGQFNHPGVKDRNKISRYIQFFKEVINRKLKNAYGIFIHDLIFLNVFYKSFDVILLIVCLPWLAEFDPFLSAIAIAAIATFLLTSFKPFLFLGEADRYLEYIVIFAFAMIAITFDSEYILLLIGIEVLLYGVTLLMYMRSSNNYGRPYLEAMAYIKENIKEKEKYVIHGILYSYINYSLTVLSNIKSIAIESNYVYSLAQNKKLMPVDTVYTDDFDYLYEEYGVNIVIASKEKLKQNFDYDFSAFEVLFENTSYVVYKRKEKV